MHAVLLSCLLVLLAATTVTTMAGLTGARPTQSDRVSTRGRRWYPGVSLTPVGEHVIIVAAGLGGAMVGLSQPARHDTGAGQGRSHGQLPTRLGLERDWFTELEVGLRDVPLPTSPKPNVVSGEPAVPTKPYRVGADLGRPARR